MSRFYKTSASNPIDWAYELPYKEMLQGLQMKQATQDAAVGAAGKMLALGDELRYLEPDRKAALAQVEWLNKGIDSLVNSDLTDPTNRAKLRDFSREVARRWGRSGIVGNIQAAYDANQAYLKELTKNEKLSQEQKRMAPVFSMSQYQGIGDETPYGGTYNTFRGVTPSDFVDVSSEWMKLSKDIENDKVTKGGSSPVNMYIKDWETYESLPNEERFKMVWDAFTEREDVQNYLRDGAMMGYAQGMDLNAIYQGGFAQKGYESKSTSKLRNDSWKNKLAQWDREDALVVDNYTDLYTKLKENGTAELDGITVKALFKDGKVALNDAILFGGIKGLGNKSPEEMELLKEAAEIVAARNRNRNGKFTFARLWESLDKFTYSGSSSKGFSPTQSEIAEYNDMIDKFSKEKGWTKEETKKKIKDLTKGLNAEQKEAIVKASMVFNSNVPVEIIGSQKAGARVVGNRAYFTVNTELVPLSTTGLSVKEIKNVNKQLGKNGEEPFTIVEKDGKDYVSIRMDVRHDFSAQASLNYNQQTGADHDRRTYDNFNKTVDYYRTREARKLEYEDATAKGTVSPYVPVEENGRVEYLPNPKYTETEE